MQVANTTPAVNLPNVTREVTSTAPAEQNAFGISTANQAEPELSAQARILQQNEQIQNQRRASLQENDSNRDDAFVRVSSSEGSAQRNNLPADKAADIYRAIERLI